MIVPLLILGAGTYALETAEMAMEAGLRVVGFAINIGEHPGPGAKLAGKPLWWLDEAIACLPEKVQAVAAIVSPERRNIVMAAQMLGIRNFTSVIHPSASVAPWAHIMFGSILNRLVAVGYDAMIWPHVIVNRGATIGHHCVLGSYSFVGPGANLAGSVVVGKGVRIGMGANVMEGLRIGEGAVIGAGALVTHDVPDGETWWGVPARRVVR